MLNWIIFAIAICHHSLCCCQAMQMQSVLLLLPVLLIVAFWILWKLCSCHFLQHSLHVWQCCHYCCWLCCIVFSSCFSYLVGYLQQLSLHCTTILACNTLALVAFSLSIFIFSPLIVPCRGHLCAATAVAHATTIPLLCHFTFFDVSVAITCPWLMLLFLQQSLTPVADPHLHCCHAATTGAASTAAASTGTSSTKTAATIADAASTAAAVQILPLLLLLCLVLPLLLLLWLMLPLLLPP